MISKNFEINNSNNIRCKIYCDDIHKLNKIVIFFHGFGGHKDNKAAERFADAICSKEKRTGVITFNLPCHGDDIKKRLVLSDCDRYIDDVVNYAKNLEDVNDVFAYGTSFGGYLVFKYIYEHGNPFKKMAFRCPGINMYDELTKALMNDDDFRMLDKGKEIPVGFDRKVLINKTFLDDLIACDILQNDYIEYADDILIMHGLKDEIVPIDSVKDFCERNVLELISVENADHRFSDLNTLNWANSKIIDFFRESY